MPDMRMTRPLETELGDQLDNMSEPRPHVPRQRCHLGIDDRT